MFNGEFDGIEFVKYLDAMHMLVSPLWVKVSMPITVDKHGRTDQNAGNPIFTVRSKESQAAASVKIWRSESLCGNGKRTGFKRVEAWIVISSGMSDKSGRI